MVNRRTSNVRNVQQNMLISKIWINTSRRESTTGHSSAIIVSKHLSSNLLSIKRDISSVCQEMEVFIPVEIKGLRRAKTVRGTNKSS